MSLPGESLPDARVFPVLLDLRNCLAEQVTRTAAGPVLRAYVWHGPTAPVMDGCSCSGTDAQGRSYNGDAWVRLVKIEVNSGRSGTIRGGIAPGGDAPCALGWLVTAEIGTYRCIPIPAKGEPQAADVITATAAMLAADQEALRRTLHCSALRDVDADEMVTLPVRAANCAGNAMQLRFTVLNTGFTP